MTGFDGIGARARGGRLPLEIFDDKSFVNQKPVVR